MPNPWLNVHKSTAARNYFFSNMTNTVIFMTLGYLRIRHTTAVPFSPLHIWIQILVVYVVKISRGRWPEHPSGKTPDECVFITYLCIHVNKVILMCSCCVWPHGNGLVGFCSLQKLFYLCFLFPIDNLSAQVLKVDIYRHILVDNIYIGRHIGSLN
jgi:hypothetical protein